MGKKPVMYTITGILILIVAVSLMWVVVYAPDSETGQINYTKIVNTEGFDPDGNGKLKIVIDVNGNGDFAKVQEAINNLRFEEYKQATLYIRNGVYKEKIVVRDDHIRFIGESAEKTILTYDDYASKPSITIGELGTKGNSSTFIYGDNFYAKNLTFRNTAGKDAGQAVALYVAGDRAEFYNVRIIANQDTLYAENGRQYYKNCYIEGTTDFIFGAATAVFDNCVIHSKKASYITAASTPQDQEYGYVFFNSKLTAAEDVEDGSVYLGRPWRPYANVIFMNTWMGDHIKPEGWHNWSVEAKEETSRYFEYNSSGPGANPEARVDWAGQLTAEESAEITPQSVLAGEDGWDPTKP